MLFVNLRPRASWYEMRVALSTGCGLRKNEALLSRNVLISLPPGRNSSARIESQRGAFDRALHAHQPVTELHPHPKGGPGADVLDRNRQPPSIKHKIHNYVGSGSETTSRFFGVLELS